MTSKDREIKYGAIRKVQWLIDNRMKPQLLFKFLTANDNSFLRLFKNGRMTISSRRCSEIPIAMKRCPVSIFVEHPELKYAVSMVPIKKMKITWEMRQELEKLKIMLIEDVEYDEKWINCFG